MPSAFLKQSKSLRFNGNFLLSSSSANASAEIGKFKMKEERGKMTEKTRHSTERMRGLESLTVYSECRDAIHRMINHPLWHDAGVTHP